MANRRVAFALVLVACAKSQGTALFEDELRAQMKATGLREPVPVAAVVGDAYWPSASPDGSALVFTATQNGTIDVWKKILATGETVRLTRHSADDEDPSISPDGKTIAFVSRRDDAKGDIFLMDMDGGNERRLTDERTSDRAPSWSPDGTALLISVRVTPDADEDVFRFDLATQKMERLTDGGGFDASLDPTGAFLIYSRKGKTDEGRTQTRIVGMRLSDKKIMPLSDGRRPEAFARSARIGDKTWVYFTRYVEDDTRDGKIDVLDLPCLYRVPFRPELFDSKAIADFSEPLSSGYAAETLAAVSGNKLFFVVQPPQSAPQDGSPAAPTSLEIQTLPLDGLVPASMTNAELFALADTDIPGRMRRYVFRIIMARGGSDALRARYELARDFAGENRLEDAQAAFDRVIELAGPQTPLGRLGRLEQLRNQFFLNQKERQQASGALAALKDRVREVAPPDASKLVRSRANVVLAEAAEYLGAYAQGLELAQAVSREGDDYAEDGARAMRVEATIGTVALPVEEEQRRLIAMMRERSQQVREVKAARTRFFELMPKDARERIAVIDRLLPLTKDLLPLRVALVLKQADTLVELAQARLAITELQRLLTNKTLGVNDRGRALFALARTQEIASELGAALQSLESVMTDASFNRVQRNRGRVELLRLALKKARADEARGDFTAAYEAYRTLAKNNFSEANAHRKVLQLGQLTGNSPALVKEYRAIAQERPFDRAAQYAYALAATYDGDLSTASAGFKKAIDLDAGFAYAHLGLGWVYEQEEYRSPSTSDALERALFEYQTALSLFESAREHEAVAEAALNLGNAFARLGQFDQAFANYLRRELSHAPFESTAQEIVFRERFGQAAVRAGEFDVALMSLRDGIRLAEREGDDRRLGRLRALLALTYDALDLSKDARAALTRARDEYATRGDFNRVVAIDRTIGWLALESDDRQEAEAALERSLDLIKKGYGPAGFKFGITFVPIGLIKALAVDSASTSRAPFGFSVQEEQEILESLLARVYSRLGDTDVAAQYQEKRLAALTNALSDGGTGEFVHPEWYQATAELMLLSMRRERYDRASELFVAAIEHYAKTEPTLEWLYPVLRVLPRLPVTVLDAAHAKTHDEAFQKIAKLITNGPKEVDGKKEETPPAQAARARSKSQIERVQKQRALLVSERDARAGLADTPAAAAEKISDLVAALDRDIKNGVGAQASSQPIDPDASSKPRAASQPASQPVIAQASSQPAAQPITSRRTALRRVQRALDNAELAFVDGRFVEGEEQLKEAIAVRKRFALFDVDWQAEYLRFRLGPPADRAAALERAQAAVKDADILARLLYPERPRPPLWHELMRAMLASAVKSGDGARVAEVLERMTIESVALPEGLARPDLSGAELSRAALTQWAEQGRELLRDTWKRTNERLEATLRAHIDRGLLAARGDERANPKGQKPMALAVEPWLTLLAAKPDAGRVADALEGVDSFEWYVPGHDVRVTVINRRFVLQPKTAPASQPASAPSDRTPLRYVAGDADVPDPVRVASANGLWLAFAARNSNNGQPVDFAVSDPSAAKIVASAVPPAAAKLRDGDVDRERLSQSSRSRIVRLVADVASFGGAPGIFRFEIAGDTPLERRLTTVQLPQLAINPNIAVIDSLRELDVHLGASLSRTFALSGTPSLILCAPNDPETHAALLKAFYDRREARRAAEAWFTATRLQSTSKWQTAVARCQYWGFTSDGAQARLAFARGQMKTLDDLGKKAQGRKSFAEAKVLYQQALEYATFLLGDKDDEALRDSILTYEATLATISTLKEDYDDAVRFQKSVVDKWTKKAEAKPDKKNKVAEAWNLLGVIYSRARQPEASAQSFKKAIELFVEVKDALREAQTWQQRGSALQAAGAYQEAVSAYLTSADQLKKLEKPPMQATSLRYAGIVQENKLSDFQAALQTFRATLQIATALKDNALISRTRLDVGRLLRQLADYEAAAKAINELLAQLPQDDLLMRCESIIELARIYWYWNDNERALNTAAAAVRIAESNLAKNKKDWGYMRIQAYSVQGLILMSQGKRVAASNRLRTALKESRDREFPRRSEESTQLNNYGFTLRERGLLDLAGKAMLKAVAIDSELKSKDGLAFDFRNLAGIRLRQGDLREAKQYIGQARELNAKVGSRYNQINIELIDGEIALVEKRKQDSQRAFEAAMNEAVKLKAKDIEWKARLGLALNVLDDQKTAQKLLEDALAIVESLGPKLESVRTTEEKINELTMSRLHGALSQTYKDNVPATWRLLERLRLKELRDQISPYTWTKRLGVNSDDANNYERLEAAAKEKRDDDLLPLLTLEPAPLDELRRARKKDAILALRVFEREIVAVIADDRGTRTRYVPMQRSDVAAAADQWMDAVDHLQPPPAAAQTFIMALAKLFDESMLMQGRILIIADSSLSRLPWASLPMGPGPLIERAAISFEISGTHAVLVARDKHTVDGPVITVGPADSDGLPFAQLEIEESRALFAERGTKVKAMTLSEFYHDTDEPSRLWHLALHGNSIARSMQGAFLRSEDLNFFAVEFLEVRREVPTVVLSACHKQGSDPQGVEFVSALRLSGTERVIVPASRVFDDQSALFVKHVIRLLAEDSGVERLRALQRQAYARGEPASVWANWQWYGKVD